MVDHADAIIIGKSGLGGTKELLLAQVNIQTGVMRQIPIVVFHPDYWVGLRSHFQTLIAVGACKQADEELLHFVPPGEEQQAMQWINRWYLERSRLLAAS